MLDTDIVSYVFAHRAESARRRFLTLSIKDVAISAITAAELAVDDSSTRQNGIDAWSSEPWNLLSSHPSIALQRTCMEN